MYNIDEIRKQFPMLNRSMQGKKLVFLDSASTTLKPQCVIDAVVDYYTNHTSNSHRGDYDLAYDVDMKVLETRKAIAGFVNCEPNEVCFTSGDTMSLNLIAWGYGHKFLKEGDEIVLSTAEHASNALPWFEIAKSCKAIIKLIPLDENGAVTTKGLKEVISNKTKVVSVAHINNVLGYEVNIKEFAKIAHENGAVLVVDGAQSVPHIKIDFKDSDIDFLTFSAHKMCGPTGIGAMIGKTNLLNSMDPFLVGGGMNETFTKDVTLVPFEAPARFEAGTLPLAEIFGFKAAVDFINEIGIENIHAHDVELAKYAKEKLAKLDNIIIYNKAFDNGIIAFNVKNVFSQDEATLLNSKGIAVRSGQHCDKMLNEFLGVPATCRASTYLYTTKEEIDALVDALAKGGDILDAYFND